MGREISRRAALSTVAMVPVLSGCQTQIESDKSTTTERTEDDNMAGSYVLVTLDANDQVEEVHGEFFVDDASESNLDTDKVELRETGAEPSQNGEFRLDGDAVKVLSDSEVVNLSETGRWDEVDSETLTPEDSYVGIDLESVSTGLSFTDPAGVEHTGELADIEDVGDGGGRWDEADSETLTPEDPYVGIDLESISTGSSFTDPAGVEHTGELADIEDVGDGGGGVDYTVNPDDFGAVGDGSTDDTQAFQDAIDSVGASEAAILELTPGNHYYLASSVTVDVNKIRVIEGNNAYVVTDNDIYAIDLVGDKSSGGSNPGSGSNSTHAENEFGTHVQNLQAYSTNYSGTAIRVRDTFATFITDCNIAKMNNAIEFTDINRNHIVANNHIWDIANFGLYFNGGSCHQILVADNFIQWAYKVIRVVDGDLADFLFMNNNLETGNNEQNQSEIVLDAEITSSTNNIWDILIEGNVFDGHNGTNTGIRLKSTNLADEVLTGVRIVNNYISQFATTGVELEEMNQVTISNNHCERNVRQVNMTGECKAVSITDNVFQNLRSSDAVDGIHWTTDTPAQALTITDNQFVDWTGPAIAIQDESTSANNRSEVTISDNTVHLLSDSPTISGYLIDLNTSATLNDVHVRGNTVRGRDTGEDGIRVQGGSYTNVIMKDNTVRGITSGTAYTAPDGTLDGVIVQDNLANGVKTGAANYFFIGDTSPDNPQAGAVWIDTS